MELLIWFIVSILAGMFLFLLAILFSRTKILGQAFLRGSKSDVRILIIFLRNVLHIQFDLVDGAKHFGLFLGAWKIYRKELTGKEKKQSEGKVSHREKQKNSFRSRFFVLKNYWRPGKQFLKQFFTQFKYFKLSGSVHLGFGSPSKTGMFYGYWLALKEFLPASSLVVQPEFLKKEASGWIATDVHVRLINLAKAIIPFWLKVRKIK